MPDLLIVDDDRAGIVVDRPTGDLHAPAEIDVLEVHEERVVEATELADGAAAKQHRPTAGAEHPLGRQVGAAIGLTDLPIGWGLAPIMYARIPEPEKRLILGGNLQRLMEQYGIEPGP